MDDEGANATAVGALSEDAGAARTTSSSSILREHVAATTTRAAEGYARARGMQLTPRASRALGELTMAFATELARDLRAFAWHADRDVIHARDVELRARKVTPTPFAGDDAAEGDEDGPRA
jgi:histone H3/H4